MTDSLKRTPLYDLHLEAGARMVEFGGWEMPVQYSGIMAEHQAVRSQTGVFDVSHMGKFEFQGRSNPGSAAKTGSFQSGEADTRSRSIYDLVE
jgi:aminomethyltransferase